MSVSSNSFSANENGGGAGNSGPQKSSAGAGTPETSSRDGSEPLNTILTLSASFAGSTPTSATVGSSGELGGQARAQIEVKQYQHQEQLQVKVQMDSPAAAPPTPEDRARYEAARKELIQALQKKRAIDRQLAQLEVQIYNFEGSYLADTTAHSGGNIIQGFDGYLKTQNVGRRRHEITDADRVFSNSSLTYQKSLELVGELDDALEDASNALQHHNPNSIQLSAAPTTDSRGPTPGPGGLTTVFLPPPSSRAPAGELSAAAQKKARDKEYQRRKRAAASQRGASASAGTGRRTESVAASENDDAENVGPNQQTTVRGGTARRPNKRPRAADDD